MLLCFCGNIHNYCKEPENDNKPRNELALSLLVQFLTQNCHQLDRGYLINYTALHRITLYYMQEQQRQQEKNALVIQYSGTQDYRYSCHYLMCRQLVSGVTVFHGDWLLSLSFLQVTLQTNNCFNSM